MLKSSGQRLPAKLAVLLTVLWVFVPVFSLVFVRLLFALPPDAWFVFVVSLWSGAAILWLLSIVVLRQICRPLQEFLLQHDAGGRIDESLQQLASQAARTLYVKLGALGVVGPLLLMIVVGLAASGSGSDREARWMVFVVLGLFNSVFVGFVLFFLSNRWAGDLGEGLANYGGGGAAARGIPLKWKVLALGFGLATMPALLVGSTSYFTSVRLMNEDAGRRLTQDLDRVVSGVAALLKPPGGRSEVEKYLSDEAIKLGAGSSIHVVGLTGDGYQNLGANPLADDLKRQLVKSGGPGQMGCIVEPTSGERLAFVFTADGSLVSTARVSNAVLDRANGTLFGLVLGVFLGSIVLVMLLGFFFADNWGRMIRRMAGVTEEVARGDLSREVRVVSDDDIGALGANLYAMTENLRRMVREVTVLAGQIAATCNQLLLKASAISTGAEIQSQYVQDTSVSVQELNANIKAASENVQALAHSSRQTADAAGKVGEGFGLMLAECSGLQQTVDRTGEIVGRMVASVREVSGIMSDFSEGARRSAMSMAEIDRSVSEVSSRAADTAQVARKAISVAQDGGVAVRRTIEGMDRIVESNRQASGVIQGLGNRIEAIGSILGVIEEITDQTNLLALNAAIIAAQAGEHGRGFAVVADEIRSLAERTGASTREIAQMISDIQNTSNEASKVMRGGAATVNEGMALAKQGGEALNQILLNVQKATENVEFIASLTERQTKSSVAVTREIGQLVEMGELISKAIMGQGQAGEELQGAFQETRKTSQAMGKMINQQAQENRLAMAAVTSMKDEANRAHQALADQSNVSNGFLKVIEQVREIAKNHAKAASEMGDGTQALAEKSAQLKKEIEEFHV